MATGYSSGWSASKSGMGYIYLRCWYSTTYDPTTNTSTVRVVPQIKNSVGTIGYCWVYNRNSNSDAGVWGNGTRLYTLSGNYGGNNNNLVQSSVTTDYKDLSTLSGSISTFTIQHNSSGVATFTVGVVGTVRSQYWSSNGSNKDKPYWDNVGGKNSDTITVTQSAPYAISYNANGGSGAPSSQSIYAGVSYTLSSTRPTRTGYNFLGWSTSSSAVTASYQPSQSVTPNGNLVLYAVWQKQSFTLSINGSSGAFANVMKQVAGGWDSLVDGDTIYYGDVLRIWLATSQGYGIRTHTINGEDYPVGTDIDWVVDGNINIVVSGYLITYILSIMTSQSGVVTNINRTSSPIGHGFIGVITNGAALYYNDELSISYTIGGAYELLTATINGLDISHAPLPFNLTVSGNVVVSITVKLGAIMYIANEAYQIFIGDGTNWNQYQAFIGNGADFEQY